MKGREFVVGEIPRPTPFRFLKEDGTLDTQWSGWTISAYVQNNALSETSFGCTNNSDGTGSIDWPTSASKFVEPGTITIKLRATQGSYNERIGTIRARVRSE